MAFQNAKRDNNFVTTLIGVDNVNFTDPTTVAVDPTTHAMLTTLVAGSSTIGTVRIVGNAGGVLDAVLGAAVPANALQIGVQDNSNNLKALYSARKQWNSYVGQDGSNLLAVGLFSGNGDNGWLEIDDFNPATAGDGVGSKNGYVVGAMNYVWNGTTFDKRKSVVNATDSTGTGISAVGMLAQFDDTSPGTVTENRFGNVRMSVRREQYIQIRDAAGNERGANVDGSGNLQVVNAAETTKVLGTVRVLGNAGAIFDGVVGASPPANVVYFGIKDSGGNLIGVNSVGLNNGDAIVGNSTLANASWIYNGTNYDRLRSASAATGTAGTGLQGVGVLGYDGANYNRIFADNADGDGDANTLIGLMVDARGRLYNGTSWDLARANQDVTLLASAGRTTTQTSADISNINGISAIIVVLDMTTVGTGSVTFSLDGKDVASGKYYNILTGAVVNSNSTNRYRVGPNLAAAANSVAQDYLPRTFRIVITANNANSATYSVGYCLVRG